MVVGGALAAAGTVLQALLRNPLAEPHLLGVSGGAAFGGVLALMLGGGSGALPALLVPIGAFAGAPADDARRLPARHRARPSAAVHVPARRRGDCNAFTGALIMAFNALADFFQAHGILFWLMGSLQTQSYCAGRGERASMCWSASAG